MQNPLSYTISRDLFYPQNHRFVGDNANNGGNNNTFWRECRAGQKRWGTAPLCVVIL
ncbi:MAG: hypothetical protein ABJA76_00155 [Mucilaginibacter sp.]